MESVSQCNFVPCSNSLDLYWLILDRMSGISLFGHKFADVDLRERIRSRKLLKLIVITMKTVNLPILGFFCRS